MPTTTDFLGIVIPDQNNQSWTDNMLDAFTKLDSVAHTVSGTHLLASGTALKGVVDVQGKGGVSIHPVDANTVIVSGTEIGDALQLALLIATSGTFANGASFNQEVQTLGIHTKSQTFAPPPLEDPAPEHSAIRIGTTESTNQSHDWHISRGFVGNNDGYLLIGKSSDLRTYNLALTPAGALEADFIRLEDNSTVGSKTSSAQAFYKPWNGTTRGELSFRSATDSDTAAFRIAGYYYQPSFSFDTLMWWRIGEGANGTHIDLLQNKLLNVGQLTATSGTFSSTLYPPQYTTSQRDALSPDPGAVIYNTTTNKLNVYTGSWEEMTSA